MADLQKIKMNTKAKGSRRERQAKRILENAGYRVTKSSNSLGLYDLVAISQSGIRLIQVKSNFISKAEKELIKEDANTPKDAVKEVWIFKDRIRKPFIEVL